MCGSGDHGLGTQPGTGAVPLQELRAHLQRADQDADGASAQERALARSRARDDRAAKAWPRPPQLCGVHPTTAFRWRHRFLRAPAADKPRTLARDRRGGRNRSSSNPSRAGGPICRARLSKRGGNGPRIQGFIRTIFLCSSPATGRARPSTPSCRRTTALPSPRRLAGVVTPRQSPDRRRRPTARRLRPPGRHPLPRRAFTGKARPRRAAPAHQQRQRLPQPLKAMASTLQRRRHQEPAQLSRWRRALEALGRSTRPGKLDQSRRRRPISKDNAIRARKVLDKTRNYLYVYCLSELTRLAGGRARRSRGYLENRSRPQPAARVEEENSFSLLSLTVTH